MNVVETLLSEKEPRFRFSDVQIDPALRVQLRAPLPEYREEQPLSHENLLEGEDEEMKVDPFEDRPSAFRNQRSGLQTVQEEPEDSASYLGPHANSQGSPLKSQGSLQH